jgi:uncharacterized membrane protein
MKKRLPAIDWMRGIVMILMATDHGSSAYNAGRPVTDTALMYNASIPIDQLQFFHRWLSHLCAPTFLFLAGTALALSIERKLSRGVGGGSIDKDLLIRGLIILGVDLFFINQFWFPGAILLQVMYAIGIAMVLMIPLRRLPSPALLVLGFGFLVAAEFFLPAALVVSNDAGSVLAALLLGAGLFDTNLEAFGPWESLGIPDSFLVGYPVLPWLAMMMFGWVFGRWLLKRKETEGWNADTVRLLAGTGIGALALYGVLRGFNTFGNLQLMRLDGSWLQWLHVSKYPPSVAFTALELGIMCLVMAGLFVLSRKQGDDVNENNPVLVFGQTAFFFYVMHIFILEVSARSLDMYMTGGLGTSTIATIISLVLLYPICRWYRGYKSAHPKSVARYL